MTYSRRKFLRNLGLALACMPSRNLLASGSESVPLAMALGSGNSNFRYIYGNTVYKKEFLNFLSNVFHLFPENELHRLISLSVEQHAEDRDIYLNLQKNLNTIKPFLSELTYAVPALIKQKKVMAEQTASLLPVDRRFEGYLEFGSTGRYLDSLEESLGIVGNKFFVSHVAPTYSIEDMIDRGQVVKAGNFINLNNYQPAISQNIARHSIDLVTVYIGFHHCPLELRETFIGSIRDVIKPDGYLIVRDHNVHNQKMLKMVALAHDVFNMGTGETWNYNQVELRNFYSLETLDAMLKKYGFKPDGKRLFQQGDPTLNALMLYKKA